DRDTGGIATRGRQAPVSLTRASDAGDLPSADQRIDEAPRVAQQLLAAPERQLGDPVPANLVFRGVRIPLVVQKTVPLVEVRRNGAGHVAVRAQHGVGGLRVIRVAVDQVGVAEVPKDLERNSLMEPALQLRLNAVEGPVSRSG